MRAALVIFSVVSAACGSVEDRPPPPLSPPSARVQRCIDDMREHASAQLHSVRVNADDIQVLCEGLLPYLSETAQPRSITSGPPRNREWRSVEIGVVDGELMSGRVDERFVAFTPWERTWIVRPSGATLDGVHIAERKHAEDAAVLLDKLRASGRVPLYSPGAPCPPWPAPIDAHAHEIKSIEFLGSHDLRFAVADEESGFSFAPIRQRPDVTAVVTLEGVWTAA